MTYVIAVANQKGGVAKTTTVTALAGALVQHGREVLAVDLDAQANLTLALGAEPGRMRSTIANVLLNSASLTSVSRETSIPGLDLVPSNAEMELAERFLSIRQDYESLLRQALGASNGLSHYDIILLDCPPSMGAVTLNALVAAHMLIIPTQPEYFSAHALRAMITAARRVKNQYNAELAFRILITMHDRRNRIHRDLSEQIRTTFGDGLLNTQIDTDTKLRESAVAGLPITFYKTQTRSALQYNALAEEILQHVQETASKPA